jgi:large subunit ribosomal protein L10
LILSQLKQLPKGEERGGSSLNQAEKAQAIDRLADKINRAKVAVLINFQGLNVEKVNMLRRELKKVSSELVVTKNTLLERASRGTNFELLISHLHGPTGVTFGYLDVVTPVKVLAKFQKDSAGLGIKAAILGTKVLSPAELKDLSNLPSREVLLSNLLALFKTTQLSLVNVLMATPRGLAAVLEGLRKKKETSSQA